MDMIIVIRKVVILRNPLRHVGRKLYIEIVSSFVHTDKMVD